MATQLEFQTEDRNRHCNQFVTYAALCY